MTDQLTATARELPRSHPPVVSREVWEKAWQEMLAKEKALTRASDALAAERRRMPWLAVEKDYAFDGPNGKASLLDLFVDATPNDRVRAYVQGRLYHDVTIPAGGVTDDFGNTTLPTRILLDQHGIDDTGLGQRQ